MRMNVLFLVKTYGMGGAQTLIRMWLQHLPPEEFHIITVPYDAPGSGDQDFVESVRKQGNDVAPDRIPWRNRRYWCRARRHIESLVTKYDIDIIHTQDNLSNVLVGIGRARWPCACVASAYGWWEPKMAFKRRLYYSLERRFALPRFDRVYTNSYDMQRKIWAGGTPEERIRVIHTGFDVDQFVRRGRRALVRAKLGIAPDAVTIGTVSRLAPEKGHSYLLEAVKLLASEEPRLRLLIVGTGPQRERIEAEARRLGLLERLCLAGFYEDLAEVFEAMDVFALPSILEEGLPTSALEAQAAGLPIVASDIGGTRETIDIGGSGFLVPPRNARSLAEALRPLITTEHLRRQMGSRARQHIQQSFTLPSMMAQMTALYHEAKAAWDNK